MIELEVANDILGHKLFKVFNGGLTSFDSAYKQNKFKNKKQPKTIWSEMAMQLLLFYPNDNFARLDRASF